MPEFNHQNFSTVTAYEIVEKANSKCQNLYTEITTNQIRNFFAHINTIRNDFKIKIMTNKNSDNWDDLDTNLLLTKPKLAYAVGRVRRNFQKPYKDFQYLISEAIDLTIKTPSDKKEKAYENFFSLIEAIVAYHKFYGGKDN